MVTEAAASSQQQAVSSGFGSESRAPRVVTFVDVDLSGLPGQVVAPEGYPVFVGWQATTYPIWNDNREAEYVQYPCVVAMWERAK